MHDAPADDRRTVEQQLTGVDGHAHDDHHLLAQCEVGDMQHATLGLVDEQPLRKEVLTGIARHTQFGENNDLHAFLFRLGNLPFYLLYIVFHVGHLHRRYGGSHSNHSVIHIYLYFFRRYEGTRVRGCEISLD